MVATMMVVPLVLVLLVFATQVLLRLQADATVAALADEAARAAGVGARPDPTSTARAGRRLREALGRAGDGTDIQWRVGPDRVEVRVRVPPPQLFAVGSVGPLSEEIDVTASAPVEGWR